jgi:hypothetical protein
LLIALDKRALDLALELLLLGGSSATNRRQHEAEQEFHSTSSARA